MSKPPLNIGPIVVTPDPVSPPKLPPLPVLPGMYQARPLPWNGVVPANTGLDAFFKKKGVKHPELTMTVIILAATAQRNIEESFVSQLSNIESEVDSELAAIENEGLSELESAKKDKMFVENVLAQKIKDVEGVSNQANSFFGRDPLAKNVKLNAVDFVNVFQNRRSSAQPIDIYNNFIKSVSAAYIRRLLLEKIRILTDKSNKLTSRIVIAQARANEDALRLTDAVNRAELKQYPASPPDVSIDANIEEATQKKINLREDSAFLLSWFYTKVRNKGDWDYKQLDRQYADFGNFHYGAVGTAAGISEGVLLRAAGAAQLLAGTSRDEYNKWWSQSPYGDDPVDQVWIQAGIQYAKSKGL